MKEIKKKTTYFFVDESGDPTFYDKYGNYIIGKEGCSKILILGFAEVSNPVPIRKAFNQLRLEIANDPYLKGIPFLEKSLRAFHAKDDCAEVRQMVFKAIVKLNFRTQFIVARKIEKVFITTFRRNENKFYDNLVSKLFQNVLHKSERNYIYIAKRGSRKRQKPLEEAIKKGMVAFEEQSKVKIDLGIAVQSQSPVGEPCLQLIDYMNWAVYRVFTRGEMRYFDFVREKVSLVWDIYDEDKYPSNYYDRNNPLEHKKISPL